MRVPSPHIPLFPSFPSTENDKVITGTSCNHVFHYDCAMEWLSKKRDHCAYCREDMITPKEFQKEAYEVLGKKRFDELEVLHAKVVEEAKQTRAAAAAVEARITATLNATIDQGSATLPATEAGIARVEDGQAVTLTDADLEAGTPVTPDNSAPESNENCLPNKDSDKSNMDTANHSKDISQDGSEKLEEVDVEVR